MLRILAFLFLSMLFTSSAYSMTADVAVEHALKNNPDLQAFRLEEEVIKGQETKARLPVRFNPTIESNVATKGKSPVEEGSRRFTDYGVKLSQEFEIAGQRGFRIGIAEKDLGRVRLEIKNRERILISEVKDAFARTIASRKKIELAKEVIRIQEQLLDFTNVGGQRDRDGDTRTERGEGFRYILEKKLTVSTGLHKIFFGLPEEDYFVQIEATLKDGELHFLEFDPSYAECLTGHPSFRHGVSGLKIWLNGNPISPEPKG